MLRPYIFTAFKCAEVNQKFSSYFNSAGRVVRRKKDLDRIRAALLVTNKEFQSTPRDSIRVEIKCSNHPVTNVECRINEILLESLVRSGEGWLSEETSDNYDRLRHSRIWVVDPIDGTREFIKGIPEWCVSIGLVEDGKVVAGGIINPATQELFLGSEETGLECPASPTESEQTRNRNCIVLASRSELERGEWDHFRDAPFIVKPSGSVAYKLAQVAVGCAAATWTLVPKHEWDVAGGTALVMASGGTALTLAGEIPTFNKPNPLFSGFVACSKQWGQLFSFPSGVVHLNSDP